MTTHVMDEARKETLLHLIRELALERGHFVLSSGEESDTYLDVRKVALDSRGGFLIGNAIISYLQEFFPSCTGIAGMTLGADPLVSSALYAAHARGFGTLSGVLVRKKPKGYGQMNFLEGGATLVDGQSCVLAVDDVITTGGSTLKAVKHVRNAGYLVPSAFCIVDRESGGRELLAEHGVRLHSLFTLSEIVDKDSEDVAGSDSSLHEGIQQMRDIAEIETQLEQQDDEQYDDDNRQCTK